MDLPQEIDDFVKETIDYTLGLPVSEKTLELKLRALEESQRNLRDLCLTLQSKLKERDQALERARAESTMNAQALKKFIEENQKLASECTHLLNQCNKLERECALYDHDREALMDFGNEADQRAKDAEVRVHELEEAVRGLSDELEFYKNEYEMRMVDSSSSEITAVEEILLDSVLATLINKDETIPALTFLEVNSGHESCQKLLKMWNCLKPSTQKILSLAAEVKALQKDKEHLRINLHRAEVEVKVLFEENNILDEANKKLSRQSKERGYYSGGRHTDSASAKSNKRKSSANLCSSPIEGKLDFGDPDTRLPLSPLLHNSPDSRMQKK